ncbi:drug/metabolite transporter (DMT)-like permease [Microbacterium sp. SORGH_AS428]|uniref:EamA family transporter n=1 Tax=Microbacterium sp. SORGH_AS_0428 TaxID=3041788 RepID=UPI00285D8167|nr:DMT family transporter [Microbacterium sp. SORGH_AS_0428]MDR6198358.1 drug/metabolite transporter (DMT)-like permease [Microbacterium sp. SORGH_AS_0428]
MVAQTSSLAVVEPLPVPGHRVAGLAVGLASALAFSSSGPVVKPLIEAGWTLGAALLVRMSLAALILSPALIRAVRRRPGVLSRQWPLIVGFGLTGVAGCQIFYFAAMQRMPVAVALLVQYLAPVLLVLLAWVRTRRAPSRLVLTGSAVAIVGLVLVVDIAGARFDLVGTLFALGAAVCVGAYFLLSERTGEELPPLALAAGGLIVGAVLMGLLCATGLLPFAAPDVSVALAGFEMPSWVAIGWVGAVATTLGYALGVIAVPMLGSRVASFVGLSEVLFALLFAWLLLGEAPGAVQILGGAVLIVGVVLVRMDASAVSARSAGSSAAVAPTP